LRQGKPAMRRAAAAAWSAATDRREEPAGKAADAGPDRRRSSDRDRRLSRLAGADATIVMTEAAEPRGEACFAASSQISVLRYQPPGVSGFELARRILKQNPAARIIMFSIHDDPSSRHGRLKLGQGLCLQIGRSQRSDRCNPRGRKRRCLPAARHCPKPAFAGRHLPATAERLTPRESRFSA